MKDEFLKDIKNTSKSLHDMAENTGFIKRLLIGDADKKSYGEYIYNLYYVYKAIEDGLEENCDNEVVKSFAIPEVYRAEPMMKDFQYLLDEKAELLMSTKCFVNRIKEISKNTPELLIAHAYTRYLADLFGGRVIYGIVKDKYKIDDAGLNYYIFDKIEDLKSFVMNYHNKLNLMELSDCLKDKFLNEVAVSYIYNISISNELEYDRFLKKK